MDILAVILILLGMINCGVAFTVITPIVPDKYKDRIIDATIIVLVILCGGMLVVFFSK